jgi:stage II sporulation protein D
VNKCIAIFLIFSSHVLYGQEMRIGILRQYKVSKISLTVDRGVYDVYADTSYIVRLIEGDKVQLNYYNGRVQLLKNGADLKLATKIKIIPTTENSVIQFNSIQQSFKSRYYQDGLEVVPASSQLTLINLVDMDNYLGGVIESEGGGGRHIEYYKVQALMSRTYALKNIKRHEKEGFQLCDGVHCQAYHNMLRHTPSINTAVKATTGMVLVDERNNLITSYFSANCGGQTCDASYVWNTSVLYLESFRDTFCIHTKQATWEKRVTKTAWDNYMNKEFGMNRLPIGKSELRYTFVQDDRKAFYIHPSLGIPLRDLRIKFNLKSTYFSTSLVGEEVVIKGRGFGHGIGLCQEGAMNMASNGYSYEQIALFYFSNVWVVDYYRGQFFKQQKEVED